MMVAPWRRDRSRDLYQTGRCRIQAGERFVEHQKPRLMHQRASQGNLLFMPRENPSQRSCR